MSLLSSIVFIPLIGAVIILGVPGGYKKCIRGIALFSAGSSLVLSVMLLAGFDLSAQGFQYIERHEWIPSLHIQYIIGIDGMSLVILMAAMFLFFVSYVISGTINKRIKEYFLFFLILQGGISGILISLDFFLLIVFWSITAVPVYFLIGIWGGGKKEYAAIKFLLYSLCGTLLILVGMLMLYFSVEPHTFDIMVLARAAAEIQGVRAVVLFWVLFIGFSFTLPIFPFHSWLPVTQAEAPTPIAVIVSGIYMKLGIYGILRVVYPLLPLQAQIFSGIIVIIGTINIIYGCLNALVQTDIKRMIAYSSMAHMGFCILGISSITVVGFSGSVFHLINHGICVSLLLILIGLLESRSGNSINSGLTGLSSNAPVLAGFLSLAAFGIIGIPGLSCFVSEFLCFLGVFPQYPAAAVIGVGGIIITAVFFLKILEKVYFGRLSDQSKALPDLSKNEILTMSPLLILTLLFGIYPALILNLINHSMTNLIGFFK